MKIDQHRLQELILRGGTPLSADELRREQNVFLVGGNLPERQTLETLYESHYQSNAGLFHLTFGEPEAFANGEALARTIKKNFNAHLLGRLEYPAAPQTIERAYAAGVDILDLPHNLPGQNRDEVLRALEFARSVFPRWSVISTVVAGAEPAAATKARIDLLLAVEVVPLVTLAASLQNCRPEEVSGIYSHLANGWRSKKVSLKPLLPLIFLATPFVPASPRGMVRGFIDIIEDRRLLAASDLRRILRVKEVAESFDSAGL
jgi:hypothetical protein